MTTDVSADDLGFVTITRDFDAPREMVFAAFLDPQQLVKFWGPTGTHVPAESVVIEPVPGGRFETTIVTDDGSGTYPMVARYVEVTPPEVLAFQVVGEDLVNTSTFTDLGRGRTRVVIRQTAVPVPYRSVEGLIGFASTLEKFADHLAEVFNGSGDRGLTQVVVAGAEGIRITRDFAATPQQVWDAWTDAASFAQWFGTSVVDVPAERLTWNAVAGQRWAAVMVLPDGNEINWQGEFTLVDEPSRLELTLTDQPDGGPTSPITVSLTVIEGGTRMVMTQGGGFMPAQGYDQAGNGWGGFFDVMHELLTP